MIEKTEPFNPTKRLPRSEASGLFKNVFPANGKTYRILDPADGFPVGRDAMAYKFIVFMMNGSDFNYSVKCRVRMREIINGLINGSTKLNDFVVANEAELKEVTELSQAKYLWAHYLCTLFMFGPGESAGDEWNQGLAEEKLDDWAKEGYSREDFLELAALFTTAYNDESGRLSGLMLDAATKAIQGETSTDGTGSKKTEEG